MLLTAIVLCLASAQEADRSTPEKALETLGGLMTEFTTELERRGWLQLKFDVIGDDLFDADGKAHRIERRMRFLNTVGVEKFLGFSFEKVRISDAGVDVTAQATRVMRSERTDSQSGKKDVESHKEVWQFGFVKDGAQWLIKSMRSTCSRKGCDVCEAEKGHDELMPVFLFVMVSEKKEEYAPDQSTPEKAAQSFVDFLTKKIVDHGNAEVEFFRSFLSRYRKGFTPDVAKRVDEAFQKSVAAGTERFRTQRPKMESFKRQGVTAAAIVREPIPPEWGKLRLKDKEHRIVLKQVGDHWLIVHYQLPCSCDSKDEACPFCKGSGWSDR